MIWLIKTILPSKSYTFSSNMMSENLVLHHGSTNFVPRVCLLDALSLSFSRSRRNKRDLRTCNGKVFLLRSLGRQSERLANNYISYINDSIHHVQQIYFQKIDAKTCRIQEGSLATTELFKCYQLHVNNCIFREQSRR